MKCQNCELKSHNYLTQVTINRFLRCKLSIVLKKVRILSLYLVILFVLKVTSYIYMQLNKLLVIRLMVRLENTSYKNLKLSDSAWSELNFK